MRSTLILVMTLTLGGCATVPSDVYYGPLDHGVGYSSMKAGTDEWSVRYTGDPHMTGSTVRDLTLLACADLATAAGYNWFVITEKVDESGSITEGTSFSGPATTQTSSGYSGGVDKLSGTMSSQTRFISQFRYEIRCFQEKPDIPGALESGPIRKELLEKYSLSGPGGGAQVSK